MKMNTINRIYQEFYGKKPNFSEANFRNLTIEMQAMAYILSGKSVLFTSYTFVAEGYVGLKLPMSMELQDMLVARRNKGNEDSEEESIKLQESVRKKVALIGKIVREKIEVTKDPIEMLRQIVYINIVKNRVLPNAKADEIANISACEKYLIASEKSIDLALQNELAKENYGKNNLDSISQNIENGEAPDQVYRPIANEQGPTKVFISEESRKKCAKDLLN